MSERAHPDPGVALMLAYQAGDESAFDRLVETYSGPVYALLTRFLGADDAREDLVQDVFLRVLRARERYRPTARLSTWLYRIAFNLTVNERARRAAREVPSLPSRPDDGDSHEMDWPDENRPAPWETLARDDVVQAVRRAIAELPERQRMALILARYEGLPYAEIGKVLECSERAIKSLVHRARESLRVGLQPFLQEEST